MSNSVPQNTHQDNSLQRKQCPKCQLSLPFSCFSPDKYARYGLASHCKKCRAKYENSKITPESTKDRDLRSKYNITLKQYNQILESQGGVCAICKQPETRIDPQTKKVAFPPVDHDHKTGDVRAILCSACNTALGSMREDPERIRALLAYAEWCQTRESNTKIVQRELFESMHRIPDLIELPKEQE